MKRYPILFVLLGILFLHITYLHNGFVWLDHGDIEDRRAIFNLTDWKGILLQQYGQTSFYRPLITLSHSLNFALFRLQPFGYHITNLLLFLLIILVTPMFFASFFRISKWEGILISIIIGVHPLGWLPVGAISYRPELLFTLFTFLTICFYSLYRTKRCFVFRVLFLLMMLLAFLSKETALVIIPLFILIWEWKRYQYEKNRKFKWNMFPWLLYIEQIGMLLFYLFVRVLVMPSIWEQKTISLNFSNGIGTRIKALVELLFMLTNPLLPPLSDAIKIIGILSWYSIALFVIVVIILYVLYKSKLCDIKTTSILLIITLLPSLNILSLPRFVSPHYVFLPMIMFSALIVLILRTLSNYRSFLLPIVTIWLSIMTMQTFNGGYRFQNDYTLFYPEVKKDNNFLEGHFYLGDYYYNHQNLSKAEQEYKMALKTKSTIIAYIDRPAAFIKLANIKFKENKLIDADNYLSRAMPISNTTAQGVIVYDRAVIAYKMKNYVKVISLLENSSLIKTNINALLLLTNAYTDNGEKDKALSLVRSALPYTNGDNRRLLQEFINRLSTH